MEKLFIPKSKMNIDRKDMPQVLSKDVPDFIKFLRKKGIRVKNKRIPISMLKVAQGQFSKQKIRGMMDNWKNIKEKPIMVTSDYFILDGNHRYAAQINIDKNFKMLTVFIDLPFHDIKKEMETYGKSFNKKLHENW